MISLCLIQTSRNPAEDRVVGELAYTGPVSILTDSPTHRTTMSARMWWSADKLASATANTSPKTGRWVWRRNSKSRTETYRMRWVRSTTWVRISSVLFFFIYYAQEERSRTSVYWRRTIWSELRIERSSCRCCEWTSKTGGASWRSDACTHLSRGRCIWRWTRLESCSRILYDLGELYDA